MTSSLCDAPRGPAGDLGTRAPVPWQGLGEGGGNRSVGALACWTIGQEGFREVAPAP